MTTETTTPTPVAPAQPAAMIQLFDITDASGRAAVDVQMLCRDPANRESHANLFTAWLAANWDELFLMFRAQLKAHNQEHGLEKPDVQATTAGPRLVAADGKTFISSEETVADAAPQLYLGVDMASGDSTTDISFASGGGGDFGGGGASASYDAPSTCSSDTSSSYDSGSSYDSTSSDSGSCDSGSGD